MTQGSPSESPFARFRVVELGATPSVGLCCSHLGALGMRVTAFRPPADAGRPAAADYGWDWSKTVAEAKPAAADLAGADVIVTDAAGATLLSGREPRQVIVTVRGDEEADSPSAPELLAQARSGLLGYVGRPSADPIRIGVPVVSYATGVAAAQAVLAALLRQHQGGTGMGDAGTRVSISAEAVANTLAGNNVTAESDPDELTGFAAGSWQPPRYGYRCSDGTIDFVFHRDDGGFAKFCEWLGEPSLGTDPRFAVYRDRHDHETELVATLNPLLSSRSSGDALEELDRCGALSSLRYRAADLVGHPQVRALGLLTEISSGVTVGHVAQTPFTVNGVRPPAAPVRRAGPVPRTGEGR